MGPKKKSLDDKFKHAIVAGVRDDFEDLLQRFTATETVRYESFVEIWREMKMPLMFSGRQNEREAREFTEECLKIAAQYAMSPYNFQVRVGALYLIYAIFNTQPCASRGMVRMTPEMWHDLMEFQSEAHRQQHLDVDYIFHKLRIQNAFNFVATLTELSYSRDIVDEDVSLPEEFTEEESSLFDIFSSDVLEQLSTVHQHYHSIKVALEGPEASAPSKSLSVIKPELISNITKALVTYQDRRKNLQSSPKKRRVEEEYGDEYESEEDIDDEDDPTYHPSQNTKRSKLKAKAFQNVVKTKKTQCHRRRKKGAKHKSAEETEQEKDNEVVFTSVIDISLKRESEEEIKMETQDETVADQPEGLFSMPVINEEVPEQKSTKTKGKERRKKSGPKGRVKAQIKPSSSEDEKSASPRKAPPLSAVLPKQKGKKKTKKQTS